MCFSIWPSAGGTVWEECGTIIRQSLIGGSRSLRVDILVSKSHLPSSDWHLAPLTIPCPFWALKLSAKTKLSFLKWSLSSWLAQQLTRDMTTQFFYPSCDIFGTHMQSRHGRCVPPLFICTFLIQVMKYMTTSELLRYKCIGRVILDSDENIYNDKAILDGNCILETSSKLKTVFLWLVSFLNMLSLSMLGKVREEPDL